ncbi:MAG TPA: FtsQ-type POTRA domain-containing protein [Spirochaetia bacterium]|nr:FtsQ-type POTRA domain-containing protein [Spirochaetales bacterium]HRS65219.1 FtsQ-type POTRA domain-containing protein [Spirochaetia bacterium]HPD79711.1 FtsQ-type POTRA domain-containing protein [Spirochaetales bacterium]HQG39644.1 FtsQ-type POTRA domain-containing protein [Spirochaetales bacterium]HQK33339.1 FtsQ-type POTRA domain-containing protein [Spirochaetales bacterium]
MMSDRALITNNFMFQYQQEQQSSIKKPKQEILQNRVMPLIILISLFLVIVILIVTMFSTVNISVVGSVLLSEQEIVRIAGIADKKSVLSIDVERTKIALEAYYKIKSATVKYSFPNKLIIHIEERQPLGIIVAGSSDTEYDLICIDTDGYIIGYEHEFPGESRTPVISGIILKNYKMGNKLDNKFLPVLNSIAALKVNNSKLFEAISEFKLEEKTNGYIEVVIYPVNFHTTMRVGSIIDESVLQVGMWMLDALKDKIDTNELKEIDLRGKIYTVKFKEAASG